MRILFATGVVTVSLVSLAMTSALAFVAEWRGVLSDTGRLRAFGIGLSECCLGGLGILALILIAIRQIDGY